MAEDSEKINGLEALITSGNIQESERITKGVQNIDVKSALLETQIATKSMY